MRAVKSGLFSIVGKGDGIPVLAIFVFVQGHWCKLACDIKDDFNLYMAGHAISQSEAPIQVTYCRKHTRIMDPYAHPIPTYTGGIFWDAIGEYQQCGLLPCSYLLPRRGVRL